MLVTLLFFIIKFNQRTKKMLTHVEKESRMATMIILRNRDIVTVVIFLNSNNIRAL